MSVNASNNELGLIAPDFSLLNIDGNKVALNELKGKYGTVIAFICNHCPYVIDIADRLSKEANELKKLSINTVAIMSNDVTQYPDDSFENMQKFAKKYNFKFPYLFDHTQEVAKNYGAVCTPDIFGFNKDSKLAYRGRIDSGVMNSENTYIDRELYNAMLQIKEEGIYTEKQFNRFGCSIKWK